jgi:hypothetical protein
LNYFLIGLLPAKLFIISISVTHTPKIRSIISDNNIDTPINPMIYLVKISIPQPASMSPRPSHIATVDLEIATQS